MKIKISHPQASGEKVHIWLLDDEDPQHIGYTFDSATNQLVENELEPFCIAPTFLELTPEQFIKLKKALIQLIPPATKTGTQLICPECLNPFPHGHTDGSKSCEECGHKWIPEI